MVYVHFYFLSSVGCPRFTSLKVYAGYTCPIDFESGIHCQADVLLNSFFSLTITVAAFPIWAFISTSNDRLLEIVDPKYLKLSTTERLEQST